MTARQWVAHAGLDPRPYESGSSVLKRTRISKTGNKHFRAALFMPAMTSVQFEPRIAAFYQMMLSRNKKPMEANIAVMRKLIHAIHGMWHRDRDLNGEKFYASTP